MTPDIIAALQYARNLIGPDEIIDAALSTSPTGQEVREDKTTFCADLVRRWETEWRNSNSIHWGDCLSWNSAREIAIRLDAALSSVEPAGNGWEVQIDDNPAGLLRAYDTEPEEWDGPLTAEERAMIDAAWEKHKAADPVCRIPPEGWSCSRVAGHEGPCAASPLPAADQEAESHV